WVEADLKIYAGAQPPSRPAVIAASASLFGEWAASLVPLDQLPNDPNIKQAIAEAQAGGGGKWPGATLPDIGQLTAQASRIATDIATVSNRIQTAFDSEAVVELRRSIKDFGQVADRLVRVTNEQADVIGSVGSNLRQGSDVLAKAATNLQATLGRVDSATNQGQLATILSNSATTSVNLRTASQDFRDLLDAAHKNQESLVRVLVSADSVMSRIANRSGTLGLMVSDSALYRETTLTMIQLRQLLSDIQANPRKYFSFSVFISTSAGPPVPHSAFRVPNDPQTAPGAAGNECGRRRLPARIGRRAALPLDPRLLSQLGVPQGTPRTRRAPGRRRAPRGGRGDRAQGPGAARPDSGDRLVLPLSRQDHPQVLPLLPVRVEARRVRPAEGG